MSSLPVSVSFQSRTEASFFSPPQPLPQECPGWSRKLLSGYNLVNNSYVERTGVSSRVQSFRFANRVLCSSFSLDLVGALRTPSSTTICSRLSSGSRGESAGEDGRQRKLIPSRSTSFFFHVLKNFDERLGWSAFRSCFHPRWS